MIDKFLNVIYNRSKKLERPWTKERLIDYADALYDFNFEYTRAMFAKDPKMVSIGFYVNGRMAQIREQLKNETRRKILGQKIIAP